MDESFTKDPLSHQHFLTFVLRDECFGISISAVKEIIEYDNVTPIPLMPEFVKGVLNLRGEVVPVIDLSVRFNKAPTEIQKRTCIVILEIAFEEQTVTIGAVVDSAAWNQRGASQTQELGKARIVGCFGNCHVKGKIRI